MTDQRQKSIEALVLLKSKKSVSAWTLFYIVMVIATLPTLVLPIPLFIVGCIHTSSNKRHNEGVDLMIAGLNR